MVKTFATALVCGALFVAYASAQEVFVGEQKAKPKYPKAEAAVDHAKSAAATEKVASAPVKKAEAAATAVASKSETATEKKATIAAVPKTAKPETKTPAATVAKAAPAVVPGQRAPAATPSPIVKPQPSLLAKTQTAAKLPPAVPPPSKASVQVPSKTTTAPEIAVASTPNKSSKASDHTKLPVVAQTKEPPPPAEGPTHDVVTKVKKQVATATAAKVASKVSASSPKPAAADLKVESAVEEEESGTSGSPTKPVVASSAILKKTVAFPKSTFPQAATEAHSIASAPATLQSRRELNSPTKVSLTQSSALDSTTPVLSTDHFETAFIKLADGFDFPVGRPDAQRYYKARGFRSHGHMGEDWDGVGGGDTDLGDPIYAIGDGLVVFARDCHMGWGNVVIIRHSYRDGGAVRTIDSLYGHLQNMLVHKGQAVARGQKIATMGTAHGLYDAHLHLEIRKNIEIGMSRAAFAQDFSNYYDPSQFIQAHRHLQSGGGSYRVAMNTFTRDQRIRWDKVRNYSHPHTGGGTTESAAALKRALASKNNG